jgi:hypothetical protein
LRNTDSHTEGHPIPHDLVDEIEAELIPARSALVRNDLRVAALEALLELAWKLAGELSRPVTLGDLLASASTPVERAYRLQLARSLRNGDPG